MRKSLAPILALLSLLAVGFFCPSSPVRLEFANTKEPGIWEFLEDSGCDISSAEADKYVECMFDIYEQYSGDYTLHTNECNGRLALVPGCNLGIFGSGTVTYECDVSHEAEETYNDEYCPLGHDVALTVTVDWVKREFTYKFEGRCVDDILDFVYNYVRTEAVATEGGGLVTETGWLFGEIPSTVTWSYECGPPRFCGNTGSAPDTEVTEITRYVVGRLASVRHLEMGLQYESYPLDAETLRGFNSWTELEAAWRGSKVWDCFASE